MRGRTKLGARGDLRGGVGVNRARVCQLLGDADSAASSYGEETYARLAALKRIHDPTNLFRLNHNIEPARGS